MTKQQYITASESDYSFGIDARSSENQIGPGFVKDLLNADIIGKRVRKRVGVQGYSGNIPVRVTAIDYTSTGTVSFTLDSAVSLQDTTVDLTSTRSSPLVVYGRSSSVSSGAPFLTTGDTARYYPAFTVPTRKTFLATAGAPPYETLTVASGEHGISTSSMFTSVVESTSQTGRSYQVALPHTLDIDVSSYDISIAYQNGTGSDRTVYVFYKDETPVAGQSYLATFAHTGSGPETFTVPAGTHGLDNYNILVQVQQDLGATVQTIPAEVTLSSTGTVSVTIDALSAGTFYGLLSATTVTNFASGNVQAGTSSSVVLSGLTVPWIFYGIYVELTPGGDKALVYPDSIDYDDDAKTATLSFTNLGPTAAFFSVYYDYGVIRSNRIEVQDVTSTVNATDTRPQLTIWGLDHSEIYGPTPPGRSGWANHIDSYRSAGDRRLVTGLGGNLFTSRTYDENGADHLYPLLYPRLQARTASALVLGPVFYDTADTPARTRGYITSSSSGTGWATVSAVAYDTGSDYTVFTLSLPGKAILDSSGVPTTLSSVISVASGLEDYITLTDMSYARHNGTFRIRNVVDGVGQIQIYAEVPTGGADYDDSGTAGAAGVFTDQIPWLTSSPFVPGDVLLNAALGSTYIYTVTSSLGSISVIQGATDRLDIAGGLVTAGRRVSSLIPLRGPLPTSTTSVANVVRGDMISYSEIERLLRVLSIRSDIDRGIDVVTDPLTELATVTLLTGDTTQLVEGGKVLLLQAGDFSGPQVVLDILSPTSFTVAMPTVLAEDALGATLVGGVIEVDEELTWEDAPGDGIYIWAERRWIPVEAPDDSYDLTPNTYVRQLDSLPYGGQDFLRSTMVVDNMYLTNYSDEVYKFDGVSLYRAGLPAWQPGLFVVQDTSASAKVVISNRSLAYTAATAGSPGGRVLLAGALDSGILPIGSSIRLSGSAQTYIVRDYTDNGTDYYMLLDRALDSTVTDTGTASEIATFRYYFRLNAVDANDNIVSSAVTGYQDHVIELTADAAIQLRLVGFPALDTYDYDRLEVEIYRTKQGLAAPFYRITTLQMDFDRTQGYITYTDTFSDSDLIELDIVSTALKGQEIGVQWQEPLRAKYVTSIGNKLILGNVKDYPQLDIQVIASGAVTNATYSGKLLTLRSSNLVTSTTTNMVDTAVYEWRNGTTGTASAFSIGAGTFSFTTSIATAAVPGDWIYLTYATVAATARDLSYAGYYQIAIVSGTTVTVNLVGAVAAGSYPNRYVIATDPTNIPVLLGVDGNLGQVNGDSFDLFDLMRRTSMAVNSTMRMVDTSLTGMSSFVPWITARGGNDVGKSGRLLLRRPRAGTDIPEVLLPASFSGGGVSFQVFVNDVRRAGGDQVSAVSRVYPSRILASYENYPEIMDNPTSVLDSESDSAVDVNSADGQEITGVIPFFGDAAFGAAQQSAILVVFKSNSIYLVDLNEKAAGRNPVQRIETEGLGCTAPYSIAATKGGIMFANESGMYCLRRDQSIQYIGKFMERRWTEGVELDLLSIAQGHHYGVGRMYKLSVPLVGETACSDVYVYNHTNEDEGTARVGAWSRYDNHPATGWANLDVDAFYSSTQGRVLSLRRGGSTDDYRDSSDPIHFTLDTRATDAGNAGIRKILDSMVVYYRFKATEEGTSVSYSVDMDQEYQTTTPFVLSKISTATGTSDTVQKDVTGILHNTQRRRGTHFQVRVENSTIDENLELVGVELRVAGLSERGILQAARTSR